MSEETDLFSEILEKNQIPYEENMYYCITNNAENKSGIPQMLREKGVLVLIDDDICGDYMISNDVCIERKSNDFWSSCVNDDTKTNIFDEIERLCNCYKDPYLILENFQSNFTHEISKWNGKYKERKNVGGSFNKVYGFLYSLNRKFRFKTIPTEDQESTAEFIYRLILLENKENKPYYGKTRRLPKNLSNYDRSILTLQTIFPNCGPKKATDLIDKFKTLERVFDEILNCQPVYNRKGNIKKTTMGGYLGVWGIGWQFVSEAKNMLRICYGIDQ